MCECMQPNTERLYAISLHLFKSLPHIFTPLHFHKSLHPPYTILILSQITMTLSQIFTPLHSHYNKTNLNRHGPRTSQLQQLQPFAPASVLQFPGLIFSGTHAHIHSVSSSPPVSPLFLSVSLSVSLSFAPTPLSMP